MQKYSISVTSDERREPAGERRRGPHQHAGRRRTPRASRPRPSVGDPGRMSTATRNARPATTRISLPCGGSHWKWRPRTTPRAERDWLTCSKRSGSPSPANAPAWTISANQPRSSPKRRGRTTTTSGIEVGSSGERHRYIITRPPSTASTWPVMNAASSRGEEGDRVGDLLGRPEPAERRPLGELRLEVLGQVLGQLGEHEARAPRRCTVMPREASSRAVALVSPIRPGLRRRVVRLARLAGLARHAR